MANSRNEGSRPDLKMNKQCAPYLEKAVSKIAERRGNLTSRQQYLKEKITALERSIPALMAFNMWASGGKSDEAPLHKIRQIMNKVSPNSDPTDKLVDNLTEAVTSLNAETAELHEKIIAADIKLEESEMELESLERANKEFEDILENLEKGLKTNRTPSLHSIHSEDLVCLTKIRQLGEEEINLKNSIRALEERETLFQEQMNRILASKDFQKSISNNESEKRIHPCPVHVRMGNEQEMKKKLMQKVTHKQLPTSSTKKGVEEKSARRRPEPMPAGSSASRRVELVDCESKSSLAASREHGGTEPSSKQSESKISGKPCPGDGNLSSAGKVQSPRKTPQLRYACTIRGTEHHPSIPKLGCSSKCCYSSLSPKSNVSKGRACPACCKTPTNQSKGPGKMATTIFQSKCCKGKKSNLISSIPEKSGGKTCKKCQGLILSEEYFEHREASHCRFADKGKTGKVGKDLPCNCSAFLESIDSGDSTSFVDQSGTDDEYCECCDCGCEDSDMSDFC